MIRTLKRLYLVRNSKNTQIRHHNYRIAETNSNTAVPIKTKPLRHKGIIRPTLADFLPQNAGAKFATSCNDYPSMWIINETTSSAKLSMMPATCSIKGVRHLMSSAPMKKANFRQDSSNRQISLKINILFLLLIIIPSNAFIRHNAAFVKIYYIFFMLHIDAVIRHY
jgi:hypothetical protein